jgi:hypothetical protein
MVQGVSLVHYRLGEVYDLQPALAEYLVMEGFASVEMRARDEPAEAPKEDRRRRF